MNGVRFRHDRLAEGDCAPPPFFTSKSSIFFPVVPKEGTEGMVYTKQKTKQMKVTISLSHI